MGVYPTENWTRNRETGTATRTYNDFSGQIVTEIYQLLVVFTDRHTCYCCSCSEFGSDPYCRNHGWAAERPCEDHGMPGVLDDDGHMPVSVQAARAGNDELSRRAR